MSAAQVQCHVINDQVSVVSDLAGKVTNVVCPQFDRVTFACMAKPGTATTGLAFGIGRIMDRLAGTKNSTCEFANANDSPTAQAARRAVNKLF